MNVVYPKGEIVWVSYYNSKKELVFLLTSKPSREFYFLYEVLDTGSLRRLGKAYSPADLEGKYNI